ncbi:inositol 2-dehydrogenase [Brenneria goodwinii]|uniref:Myo-inositol 2-dehydrogenase n=1 Tax=Brenneria goodwinii TaxID=1109412 RepID=A0A0G4JXW1_9GAMM|nr:inositol 2-dehydrogenase [Brenneria goodwinii]CPR18569.1 Myo-inositol 2-dehydrogenase [Brenneria goodwinii]
MLKIALLGAGRIAKIHANNIDAHPDSTLYSVSDISNEAAQSLASQYQAKVLSVQEAINHPDVDIVLVATSTETHAEFSLQAARASKAIFCEKPIDLNIDRVKACVAEIKLLGVPFMIGFNRRFDPNHAHLQRALRAGEIGELEHLQISSRDPSPLPDDYLLASGGMFRDMTIHDFDMARFQLGEEPVAVSAIASALVSPSVKAVGDIDTAVITLQTASGKIAVINNSRRSGYGYDQRIEAHGQKGALRVDNVPTTTLVKLTEEGGVQAQKPLHFFLERYHDAFKDEWNAFITALKTKAPMPTTASDGLKALMLAEAAIESLKTQKVVKVSLEGI